MYFKSIVYSLFILTMSLVQAQFSTLEGHAVHSQSGKALNFMNVYLEGTALGTVSNEDGFFTISNIPFGDYRLILSGVGYEESRTNIKIDKVKEKIQLTTSEEEAIFDQVVVTATKTFQSKFSAPVIVQVIKSKSLEKVQACNLAEGLKFQPGLRVETDCQTCNYTQLRINGLAGGYSQILINGRPIFSALNSLYGLEQVPRNMIDRIETVKGGGSALYGSNAIAGTVNIPTKIPEENNYQVEYTYQNINGGANDHFVNANGTILNKKRILGHQFSLLIAIAKPTITIGITSPNYLH